MRLTDIQSGGSWKNFAQARKNLKMEAQEKLADFEEKNSLQEGKATGLGFEAEVIRLRDRLGLERL